MEKDKGGKMGITVVAYTIKYFLKIKIALAGVAQCIKCRPANQRVASSIPS